MCFKSFCSKWFSAKEYIDAREELEVLARFINDCRNPAAAVSALTVMAVMAGVSWRLFSGDRTKRPRSVTKTAPRCTMSGLKKDLGKAVPWL
jgi:hypothetical protein